MSSANPPSELPSLLNEEPLRAILRLALPTTGVMLIGATSNILYTYFVSRLGSEAIAALSLVFPVSLIMITLMAGGIGPGVSSAIARSLGSGRPAEAAAVAEHAFLLTTSVAIVFTLVLECGAPRIFSLLGGEGEVLRQATLFARILFSGLVFMCLAATLDSVMRGEGNVRVPALCGALSLAVQIVLAPVLMFVVGLGLAGAPLATLIGQLAGVFPRVRQVFGGMGTVRPGLFPRFLEWRHVSEVLQVGIPSSLTALVNYVGMMILTAIVARFGTASLAAFGLGTRLGFVLFTVGYGVAAAALTLVGMAAGAGHSRLVTRYARHAVAAVSTAVLLPAAILIWRPVLWFGLFTDDAAIHGVGHDYLRTVGPSYLFAVAAMVLGSCFQALRQASRPLVVASVRVTAVLCGALVLTHWLGCGPTEVFLLMAAGTVLSTAILGWMFHRSACDLAMPERACTAPPESPD